MERGPGWHRARALASAAVALAVAPGGLAAAAERWEVLGGTLTVTGELGAGAAMRTSPRSPALVPAPNAAALGASGSAPCGRNSDDGDLNFARGDLVSAPVKASLALDLDGGSWGARDGVVSAFSWGYRVRAAATFRPRDGVRLAPSAALGHDVRGRSYDGNLLEGRMTATLALRAEYGRTFTEVSWSPIWGGDYNALKDRSWASASMGVRL